ncbi:hypothetical protein TSUD_151360 [Trifolium subterraneum]|uniref:Guanylyl cyclase n=1 Tax=Trifolium subterraneum TaxID=3900 RepID=A0A2Z6NUR6_TRISU|nr:hypothetical protein TSUD_151360 [Trifolium subterraneum]
MKRASIANLEESYWLLGMGFPLVDTIECIKGFYFTMSLCAILTLEREIVRDPSLNYRFSVAFSYFTVTFGANPNYCGESFYKEELPNDLARVDMLFKDAVEAGIDIQCRSISEEEISFLILSGKYIAIALVDHSKLSHAWQDFHVPGVLSSNSDYTGHYVLICGFDAGADMFEIRDPASSRKHKRISSKSLEEARKAFGTDEDILLISLEKSKNDHQPSQQLPINSNTDS